MNKLAIFGARLFVVFVSGVFVGGLVYAMDVLYQILKVRGWN